MGTMVLIGTVGQQAGPYGLVDDIWIAWEESVVQSERWPMGSSIKFDLGPDSNGANTVGSLHLKLH